MTALEKIANISREQSQEEIKAEYDTIIQEDKEFERRGYKFEKPIR